MLVKFAKAQSAGNDFVLLDLISQRLQLEKQQIQKLADRHFGIGCDQLLAVEVPTDPDMDFMCRFYNADGSEAEQCGNGARCLARFIHYVGLTCKTQLRLQTITGSLMCELLNDGMVQANLGQPCWTPAEIPFLGEGEGPLYKLTLPDPPAGADAGVEVSVVSFGNPHAVVQVQNLASVQVAALGAGIALHPAFPNQANVGFLEIRSRSQVGLRVFERGVGETLACGSGACAAMVTARQQGLVDDEVEVCMPGGTLKVVWQGDAQPVYLTGPVIRVFEGQISV